MEKKMFGKRGTLDSAKEGALKIFRLIRSSVSGDSSPSSHMDASEDLGQSHTFNLQAHIASNQRLHEIETERAMMLHQLRHERWKAGGPL